MTYFFKKVNSKLKKYRKNSHIAFATGYPLLYIN